MITEWALILFDRTNPHKVYICNLKISLDGLISADFLEKYECEEDIKNKQLITNFKRVPLFKAGEHETVITNKYYDDKNEIFIQVRTDQVFKITTKNLKNTEAILLATEIENVRLANAIVINF